MDIATALTNHIKCSGTESLIGAGTSARIYGDFVKQSVNRPYVILFEGGGQTSPLLVGTSGCAQSSFQIWSVDDDASGSVALWEIIRVAIDRYGPGYMDEVWVQEISQVGWRETGVIQPRDNSPQRLFYTQSTYDIWYSVPTVAHQGV